jgi:hypothetical protein
MDFLRSHSSLRVRDDRHRLPDLRNDVESTQAKATQRPEARSHLRLVRTGPRAGSLQVDRHHQHRHNLHYHLSHAFRSPGKINSSFPLKFEISNCNLPLLNKIMIFERLERSVVLFNDN